MSRSGPARAAGMHPAALPVEALLAQCDQSARRRSGPGGQHRNKVETGVVIVHRPTGISAQASERRSRPQNAAAALQRLRVQLALDVRTPPASGPAAGASAVPAEAAAVAPPSALWRARCRGGRITVSADHEDFPALLADVLDAMHAADHALPAAAAALGASATQLVRLLAQEPRALVAVNAARAERGMHPLHG
jgi:hypothetical protein